MPIASTLDQVCGYGLNFKYVEPVKKNNARLYIVTGNLIKVLKQQFLTEESYLTKVATALTQGILPLDVSFTPPSVTTESRSLKGYGNTPVNYAGWTTFGNMTCTFNNFLAADTFKFFYFWATLAGGLYLNFNQEEIIPQAPTGPLSVPDINSDGSAYRVNASISQYYTNNNIAGDEIEYNRWIVQNIWPTSVSCEGFNLEDMGTIVKTSVEFAADMCLPTTIEKSFSSQSTPTHL